MYDPHPYLDALAAHVHPDGGWGYAPDQAAHLEPTCLALLALAADRTRYQAAIDQGWKFLRQGALPDGSYRLARGREEAVWPTALVLFAQVHLGAAQEEISRTASRLLALRGRPNEDKGAAELQDIDLRLIGWPWAENNFSWVEPTAWACLALRHAGKGDDPRVREGHRLLLNRAFDEGGVNYGNRVVLGKPLDPIPGPTAIMLLALQGHGHEPRVASAVTYLARHARTVDDLEHLCWAKLALDAHSGLPGVAEALAELDERILAARQARAETPWLRPAPLREALTALALGTEQGNCFRLHSNETGGQPAESQQANGHAASANGKKRPPLGQRLKSAFRGMAIEAVGRLRQLPPRSTVHIAPATDYNADLADVLRRQFEGFRERVPLKGKRVVLKPNLVEYHRHKVINTHPHVVAAVIEFCRREGASEVIVAEGPGHWRNVEYLVSASGLGDVLRHHKVPFVDLNHDEPVKLPNMGRLTRLDNLFVSRTVATAEVLISLPKLKTHHWAGATLSLKNLFGTLPGICYGWPKNELHWRGIENSIVDIALTRTPDLAIVDGIVGMEGDGPLNGTAKPLGALVMGTDLVAVDATCCRLMKLDPERMGYLILGHQKRLGHLRAAEIEQTGETIESLAQPFDTVKHLRELCMARSA